MFPECGRNWESLSPDPYLCGEMVAPAIRRIQDEKLIATTRDFIGNEQQHFRWEPEAQRKDFKISDSISMNLDDA